MNEPTKSPNKVETVRMTPAAESGAVNNAQLVASTPFDTITKVLPAVEPLSFAPSSNMGAVTAAYGGSPADIAKNANLGPYASQPNVGLGMGKWNPATGKFELPAHPQGPQQPIGMSQGVADAVGYGGLVTGGLNVLTNAYFAQKNLDMEKKKDDYLKSRDARQDMKESTFAKNVGGGATA